MQVDVHLLKIASVFTWTATNALIRNLCSPMKKIGFLPVIPHPVTSYSQGSINYAHGDKRACNVQAKRFMCVRNYVQVIQSKYL